MSVPPAEEDAVVSQTGMSWPRLLVGTVQTASLREGSSSQRPGLRNRR